MSSENGPGEDSLRQCTGKVWVAGEKVFVRDPSGDGKVPTITPCEGVDLLINGNKVSGKTAVCEKDEVVIKPCCTEEPGTYKISIAPDGLSAVLEMGWGTVSRYHLQDHEPESDLAFKVVKLVEKSCPFNLTGLMSELFGKNITYGVKHGEVQSLFSKTEDGVYVIAEGDPPGVTIDERLELNFASGPEEEKSDVGSDKINFRDMVEILSVDPGALLAVKHSGVQGKPGRKVTGEILPAAAPQVLELTGGVGVEIAAGGGMVYAKIGGRPAAKKSGNRYFIDVDPVLHKKGDVDISSGNIRFKGDVVIHGDVCEGMTVQAAGKINILGMVFDARIATQGDITAGQNITGSSLVAGGNNIFFKSFDKILEALQADLSEITKMVPELARHPKLKNTKAGQLVQLLIDKKYTRVPGLITEMIKLSGQNSFILPRGVAQLVERLEKKISGLNLLKLDSIEEFHSLLSEMKHIQKIMDSMAGDLANITFGYSVNSKIEASGDVKVIGRGCINTTIRAGGGVNIKGVFRGGEIIAGGDITLNEAGSEMGVRTLVRAADGKKISIKKAHEGVRIKIGERLASITSMQSNIKARLDEEGALAIYPA